VNTVCPVSGKPIDPTKFVDFEGKRIAFCCDNCPKAFAADPAKFKDKIK
jgi:YHS domain-containing protein